jgi:hypothetical protein
MLVVAGWGWFRSCRRRLSGSYARHEPIEVRTRPHHEVVIPQNLAVVALARDLPEPVADLARPHAHRCLLPLLPTPCTILFVLHEALSRDRVRLRCLARLRTGAPRLKFHG